MLVKLFDFGILIPALAVVIASFFFAYSGAENQPLISLKGEDGEWVFPLDADETVTVRGPLGDTVIEIRKGAARFVSSPCANQTCVMTGAVHSHGQWAACLPNKVMLYIEANAAGKKQKRSDDGDIDAVVW
jgi:hypothetical protein